MHGTQIDISAKEKISKTRKFWVPTMMEETRPVVFVNCDFEY